MAKMQTALVVGRNGLKRQMLSPNPYYTTVLKISFGTDHTLQVAFPFSCGND